MTSWESIPGETPLPDRSGLKRKHITTRAALSAAEAENIRRALVKYLAAKPTRRQAPFTPPWFQKLHKDMFGQVWSWAGTLRTGELNLGLPARQLPAALHNFAADLDHWQKEKFIPPLDQSVYLHHRAVAIHPFLNGNGRWARLLANIWLRRLDHPLTLWPEQTVGHESPIRQEYLTAFRAADSGNYDPLRALHHQFTAQA